MSDCVCIDATTVILVFAICCGVSFVEGFVKAAWRDWRNRR